MMDTTTLNIEMLAVPPAEFSAKSPKKDWETLTSCWTVVREYGDACSWVKGDLVSELVATFGGGHDEGIAAALDKFSQETGEKLKTLKQYRWVSEKFPSREDRMNPSVSWSHYRSAAGTPDPMYWVQKASDEGWSVHRLEEEIRNANDQTSVAEGRPCMSCGSPLGETGSLHVRRDGAKEGSFCCVECLLRYYLQVHKNEQASILQTTAAIAEATPETPEIPEEVAA